MRESVRVGGDDSSVDVHSGSCCCKSLEEELICNLWKSLKKVQGGVDSKMDFKNNTVKKRLETGRDEDEGECSKQ